MTWAVVIFPAENAVEVVPISWYINQSKECFWPPKNVKKSVLVKQIQNCEQPDVDWAAHPAKLLGQYDCLDIAQKKARRAEEQTDISSSDAGRGVRKPKPNLKYANTSEEDNESSEEDDFPKFTPQKAFRSLCTTPKSSSSIKNKTLQPEGGLASASNNYGKSQCIPEVASETVSAAHTSFQPNKNVVVETGPALITTSKHQLAIEKDVQKILQEEVSLINMKLDLIIDRLKINERNSFPTEFNKKGIEEFFSKIPVLTNECLTNLEDWLTIKENYNIAVLQLSRIGGSTMPQATRKSLYRMLGNEVAELFSWDGAKKKRPFKNLFMAKVLLDSIKMTFLDAKEDEIIGIIKIWLVKAKERMKKKPQNEHQNNEDLGE